MPIVQSIKSFFGSKPVLIASILFVLINALLVATEKSLFIVVPVFFIFLLFYIWFPNRFYKFYLLLSPLSIPLSEYVQGLPFDLWMPSELFIVALAPLVFIMLSKSSIENRWFSWQPVLLVIYFFLGWLLVATINSTMPVVSAKYLVLKVLYFMVLFYLPFILFSSDVVSFKKFLGFYIVGMSAVILITLWKQWERGLFDKFVAHGTCNPFFTDHTSYAATLALLIPVVISFAVVSKKGLLKWLNIALSLVLIVALVLSYTRAAWLSLIVAGGVGIIWWLKIRFRYVVALAVAFVVTLGYFQDDIMVWLNQNRTASSGDLRKHISSIANIRTDESNVERLNRWTSAIRMFEEKPVFGWGPGTYMFQYAPFQASYLKTRESSNLGLKGNAHSEYLGLLADAGIPAVVAFILIIVIVFYDGFNLALRLKKKSQERTIVVGVLLGWVTYVSHGFLNNFLDMDKVAILFWGYAAYIYALKFRYRNSKPSSEMSSKTLSDVRS
ncbi:MAG: hypothetical protein PWR03_1210 [Tenuifilum sp.]|jgi:O-antigen ligase|uniref:O-antigen ligase family protein n=1 Tax=Tenuifilum sp. TaxID=2760880 RepID=UPI0024AA1031|nr:O-antigen ligase family protein [Tenuifilum sp.]MDI3527027.1 hypothetical protein [Tenuifilum sp.]